MKVSPWQRRIDRAQELVKQYAFAAEILGFYIHVARFQDELQRTLSSTLPLQSPGSLIHVELTPKELSELTSEFESFLSLVEAQGPKTLAELSHQLRTRCQGFWTELLKQNWSASAPPGAQSILALAFLQPYAELLNPGTVLRANSQRYAICPFCNRKPALGVLRQMGDGAARSLICSFCLAEWEFRRIVCPGCGEENDQKLAVFTADDFDYVRLECCDSCKTYLKTIDLSKNGRAEPVVDELASAPLDLWAQGRGYAKLQNNLLGI